VSRFVTCELAALALAFGGTALQAQARVTIGDLGPGASGRILSEALARPHRLVEPDTGWFIVRRGEHERATLIVLGRSAAIAGNVDGDVIVVGGDLFVRPGAQISERAIAIGGGVYPSSLAFVGKGSESFRDNTFTIIRASDGYRLEYRSLREHASPPLLFPGIYGLRLPSYDRVNGASVPFGPSFSFAGGRGEINGLATYRSDLGKIDPSLTGQLQLTRRLRAVFSAERGTFSNDAWIWSGFVNSLSVLALGTDTRNYYRADRADFTVHRLWERSRIQFEPFIGGQIERAWSVGPAIGEPGAPWSVLGRTQRFGMRRPNPAIAPGNVSSALAGSALQWESQGLKLRARTRGEANFSAPADERFTQVTSDIGVGFLTFGEQEYGLDVHWVTTAGDTPPPQRFAYLGGSGTMPFLDLLEQGGDELLLIDQRYSIPLLKVRVGILGIPTLQFRHRMGSAGVGRLPSLEQMIGVGVSLTIVRGEVQLDPVSGKVRFGAGFTFSR
jgi:hypothetical protein